MSEIIIDDLICNGCGNCVMTCPDGALSINGGKAQVNTDECTVCAMCIPTCPFDAISLLDDDK